MATVANKNTPPVHKDIFGREIAVGDAVAFPHANQLYIGTVIKISPKQIRVVPVVGGYRAHEGYLKYANQCVLVDGPQVTMYILKNSGSK